MAEETKRYVGDLVELPRPTDPKKRVAFAAAFVNDVGNELRQIARDEVLWLMAHIRDQDVRIAELERENANLEREKERIVEMIAKATAGIPLVD